MVVGPIVLRVTMELTVDDDNEDRFSEVLDMLNQAVSEMNDRLKEAGAGESIDVAEVDY